MGNGLTPDTPISRSIRIDREIPYCARQWGRILDTGVLQPGDLILVRSVNPDRIGKTICDAQRKGGFSTEHAHWTHAAVYLGDGESICEATFKERGFNWGVIMRSIHYYCNSETAIKARRPINLTNHQRIGIALGAVSRIGNGYSFSDVKDFAFAALSGRGFWQGNVRQRIRPSALVCSTLYQDAYNFAFRGNTIRMGSLCTPAHLSASGDLVDVDPPLCWLGIA